MVIFEGIGLSVQYQLSGPISCLAPRILSHIFNHSIFIAILLLELLRYVTISITNYTFRSDFVL